MKTAIIGLPQVGKTSLFTILTGAARESKFGSTAVQVGIAKVPDERLDALAEIFQPPKVVQATIEYADMPALSREALRDAQMMGALRLADSFMHVVRVFDSDTVAHVEGDVDPERDWKNVEMELILADLTVVEKRLERVAKDMKKAKTADLELEQRLLLQCQTTLEEETPLRELELSDEEAKKLRGFQFLSEKPMLLVLNLGEEQADEIDAVEAEYREKWLEGKANLGISAVCGSIEAEIAELPDEEAKDYMDSYGLAQSGMVRLIQATYSLLGLMSFLTAGETEVRAWTIPKQSTAVKAAGAIHSDFEKKFIRAETINWKTLVDLGGYVGAKQKGVLRLEGKEYIVQDGDVLVIRHS